MKEYEIIRHVKFDSNAESSDELRQALRRAADAYNDVLRKHGIIPKETWTDIDSKEV